MQMGKNTGMRPSIKALMTATVTIGAIWGALFAPAQAKDEAKLSREQVDRILKVALEQGTKIPVPPPIVTALHLTQQQVTPSIRQVTFQDPDGVKHGFAELADGTGFFLFRRSPKNGVSVFHSDREFQLIGAIHNFESDRFMELSNSEARAEWADEISKWAQLLDKTSAQAPASAPPSSAPKPGK
jgi:hypothetical protein